YKEHDDGPAHGSEAQRLGALWLQSLIDIQDETRDAGEFLEHVKIDLYPDAVYVFTPMSKILALPRGATPVDFAYAIHTDVGDHCVAANVNGEPVPLRAELRSGDVVEIIGAPNARPNPAWLNFVVTGRARSKIRHYLKNMEQDESRGRGEGLTVHTAECSIGKRLLERDSERWMRVDWAEQPTRSFETAVSLLVKNGKGVLAQVASAVSHAEADITHIDMGQEPASETTELKLLLSVRDR